MIHPLFLKIILALIGLSASGVYAAGVIGRLPAAHPDELAFYSRREGNFEIYLADVDRSLVVKATRTGAENTRPSWSPNGRHIAFYSARGLWGGESGLYVMDADGRNLRFLVEAGISEAYPIWSPDSAWLVYAGGERDSGSIYRIDPTGGAAQQISHYRAALLAFSPDGRRVIFMSECDYNCDLFVMDADGANMRQLTQNGLFDVFPAWSPDSQYITFMSNRDRYFEIYVLDVDCSTLPGGCLGNIRRLTINRDFDGFPAWSPDGKVIVFSSDRSGEFELFTVEADCAPEPEQCEETVRRLTDHPQRDLSPTWSPDGSRIAFISGRDVYVMDADGNDIRFIARDVLPDQFLAWRP